MLAALTGMVSVPGKRGPRPDGRGRRSDSAGLAHLLQALGCILYLLCFGQHPFEDGAKLRIVNGKYAIPADDTRYSVFHGLIRKSHLPASPAPL